MEGSFRFFVFFYGIDLLRSVAIYQESTIKPIFLEHPVLPIIRTSEVFIYSMIVNYDRYLLYARVFFFQLFFQHTYTHINHSLILARMFENRPILHDYIDSFKMVGKKLFPRHLDLSSLLCGESTTHHQQGNQPQNENLCFHFYLHSPIRIFPLPVKEIIGV